MTTSLAAALDGLAEVAQRAGLPPEPALAEGAAFAAAIAESASGAAPDWLAEVRRTKISWLAPAEVHGFFQAAIRGRRWRGSPTTTLIALVATGSPHAADYAAALAAVASSACGLGQQALRVIGNASVAAAAQLSAVPPRLGGHPPGSGPLQRPSQFQPSRSIPPNPVPPNPVPPNPVPPNPVPPAPMPAVPLPGVGPLPGSGRVAAGAPSAAGVPAGQGGALDGGPAPQPTLDELLADLDDLIGLERIKREVHRQAQVLRVERLRAEAGLRSPAITRHLVFVGNPGTGKTTVARLIAGIYRSLGLLAQGQLIEVDRSELVAGYLGQTAAKTAEVVASALGGVLFVDEAYSLAGDQYGQEAIDTLVKEMEDHREELVVIVAGYPEPMAGFIAANPGLSSRFRTVLAFDDYTDDELAQIFAALAADADFEPSEDCRAAFRELLGRTPRGSGFGNGRFARNVLEEAIGHHAWRLREVAEPTIEQLRVLLPEDVQQPVIEPNGATS